MVEMEMEVDLAPQYRTESYLDDDLIDYDTEGEKEPDDADSLNAIDDKTRQADENVDFGQQTHEDVEYFEEDDSREALDAQTESHTHEQTGTDHDDPSNEIDYDVEDASNLRALRNPSETRSLAAAEQDLDEGSYTVDALGKEEAERQVEDQEDDHEISWEHEHEQKVPPMIEEKDFPSAPNGQDDHPLSVVPAVVETTEQEHNKTPHLVHTDLAEVSGVADDLAHDKGVDNGPEELEILEADRQHQEEYDTDSQKFPAITVQYKGDEFPCFSATSDGFFSQPSLLDESMKSLLEGFREELTNELLDEDELVFQVDELGLEFSESCSPDLLVNVTLRQVVEIFDVLVKNQDSDGIRPLYTYLFTRPSTSKRLDFLMESAAEGKGLDEVIHLFQSPMPHAHGADNGDVPVVEDDETQLDESQSAGDAEVTGTDDALSNLDPSAEVNEVDVGDGQVPHQREIASRGSSPGAGENYQMEEENTVASGALAAEDDVGDGEEVEEKMSNVASQPALPIYDAIDDGIVRPEASEATEPVTDAAVDLVPVEADDILGIDFDEPVDLTAVSDAAEAQDEVEQQDTQSDNMYAGVNHASTTTTTLNGDVEILSAAGELDTVDDGTDELLATDEVDQEAEGEIDWRDDPDTLLDDVGGETSSNTGKRARDEEENDAEHDQDAKRRRP